MPIPEALSGHIEILPDVPYPEFRIAIIAAALVVAVGLYVLIAHTRIGMLIRVWAMST